MTAPPDESARYDGSSIGLTRSGRCCSDWQLDRLLAGELSRADEDALRLHLAGSPPCRERLDEIQGARTEFLESGGAPVLPLRPRSGWRSRRTGIAAIAAACAVLVVVAVSIGRRSNQDRATDAVRVKGTGAVTVLVERAGVSRTAVHGDRVAPGDILGFVVRSPTPAYVAVLGRDARSAVTVYFPSTPMAEKVEAIDGVRLDSAIELDSVPGEETVLAFFCEEPVPVAALADAVRGAGARLPAVSGCGADRVVLVKDAVPEGAE
jgi:putative zinc finger protein